MFKRRLGKISASLGPQETELLRGLVSEYLDLLKTEQSGDPVLKRLFPEAGGDDPEVTRQFNEVTGDELNRHKQNAVEIVMASLPESGTWRETLSQEQWGAWLTLLTDLRLTIGTRLNVTEDTMEKQADPRDPQQREIAVLHYLGALQESLVSAVNP